MTFQHVVRSILTTTLLLLSLSSTSSSFFAAGAAAASGEADTFYYKNELIEPNDGWTIYNDYTNPLPHTYIDGEDELPDNFNWGNVNGRSYLTHSLNQHIPQ